jgi:Cysteine-rich CWC
MIESRQLAATCPLCGSDNQCAIAAGRPASACWCQTVTIDTKAMEKAADTASERCLCPACGAPTQEVPREG